jgi:hypothetical protein
MRKVFCWMMIAFVPASLLAVDSGVALARPYGTAWLNGTAVEKSSAIFPGDVIQTGSSSALKIGSSGSSVTVLADSAVTFDGGAVSLQHGSLKLSTSRSMSARAGSITAAPASGAWTEFEIVDVAGTVQIVAIKGDLQIKNGTQTMVLPQGQQATQKNTDSDRSAANPLANASVRNASFVVGTAGASAEAISRALDSSVSHSLELAHSNIAVKIISPVR